MKLALRRQADGIGSQNPEKRRSLHESVCEESTEFNPIPPPQATTAFTIRSPFGTQEQETSQVYFRTLTDISKCTVVHETLDKRIAEFCLEEMEAMCIKDQPSYNWNRSKYHQGLSTIAARNTTASLPLSFGCSPQFCPR